MSRIEQLIARFPFAMAAAVIHQRKVHSCLMELNKADSQQLAKKAVYLNYINGEGRMLGSMPRSYRIPDGKGGFIERETYFHYINKVH